MRSRAWYLTVLVPLVIGGMIAWTAFSQMVDNIEAMPRLVAPGARDLTLAPGDYIVYAETESVVDGAVYRNERYAVRCALTTEQGPIELHTPTGRTTYSLGDYAGRAVFTFTLPTAGAAHFSCTSEEGKVVLAIGGGIGASIVVGVVSLVFGVLLAGGLFTIIFIQRRAARKRT